MADILTTTTLHLRDCGYDEFWLRDRIHDDPSVLKLGELQVVMKEKTQSQGGRLDLLLKNPIDDSMFEVELQVGRTDESHIIRTIEYWDNEKRRWPGRSHTAVLVAEEITNRFFNVVHLLSKAVPIIGIQVSMVRVDTIHALHFTKIIDSYEEPEEVDNPVEIDRSYWTRRVSNTTLDIVDSLVRMLQEIDSTLSPRYNKTNIAVLQNGRRVVVCWPKKDWLSAGLSVELTDPLRTKLEEAGLEHYELTGRTFSVYVRKEDLQKHAHLFTELLRLSYDESAR